MDDFEVDEFEEVFHQNIVESVEKMTLSASGWRGVFNMEKDEHSTSEILLPEFTFISYFAAVAFSNFLYSCYPDVKEIVLARDTRPTGNDIEKIAYFAFKENAKEKKVSTKIRTIGIACIPEVINYARSRNAAFFYISASHNPIGYNGFKFGLGKYGVLEREQAKRVLCGFRGILIFGSYGMRKEKTTEQVEWGYKYLPLCDYYRIQEPFLVPVEANIKKALAIPIEKIEIKQAKKEALEAYANHIKIVASGASSTKEANDFFNLLKTQIANLFRSQPIYIVCDFNGSSRASSIDSKLLKQLKINFLPFNDEAGKIAHEIIPEGKNLNYLCEKLEAVYQNKRRKGIFFGYMPDCDGDRGNIVYIDREGKAQIIKSQEVFALATIAEILFAKQSGKTKNLAVIANGPTSMLMEELAQRFGFAVFRAEVGEANVVNLAKVKSAEGYDVRILGEGSNGGCIINPSLVRDPLCTIFALLKFFLLKLNIDESPVTEASIITFSQLIESLPHYEVTPVGEERAILHTDIANVKKFRKILQNDFLDEWERKWFRLFKKYDLVGYKAFSYVGTETIEVTSDFSQKDEGGLKIIFYNSKGMAIASIWMRQSGTEPVFRLMVDIKDGNEKDETEFILWGKRIIESAEIYSKYDDLR